MDRRKPERRKRQTERRKPGGKGKVNSKKKNELDLKYTREDQE